MMRMMTSLADIELKKWLNIFGIIFLSLLTGIIIVYVNGAIAIGLFVGVMVLLYLKKIENIFLLWLLFYPLFNVDALAFLNIGGHPILTFDRVVIGVVLLFVLFEAALGRRDLISMNKLEVAIILFSAVILYSIIDGSADKISGARVFVDTFLYPFIIYFLAKNLISDEKNLNKFVNVLLIVGIYASLLGILEYLTGSDILTFREGIVERAGWLRINGPYKNDTAFGVNVSICFFIALYKFITSSNTDMKKRKVFYSLIFVLLLLAVFFNFYRGIWLALIIGLIAWFLIRRKGLSKLTFFVIILAIVMVPIFNQIQSTRFFSERLTNIQTIQSRLNVFDEAIYLFKRNPIKGIGFNNYSGLQKSQHNMFLAYLSETGILGTSAFMILTWFLFYYGFKNYRLSRGHFTGEFSIIFLCILICYSVTWLGLTTGFIASINKLFFAVAGASLGTMKDLY